MGYPDPSHPHPPPRRRSSASSTARPHLPPRHEDDQPSEHTYGARRPSHPPQLFPVAHLAHQAQDRQLAQAAAPDGPRAGSWADSAQGDRRAPYEAPQRGRGRGGHNAAPPRRTSSRNSNTVAGTWADAPARGGEYAQDSGYGARDRKGKGREVERPVPSGSGAGPTPVPVRVPENPRHTLFVGRLPLGATEDEVRVVFARYGTVTRVNVSQRPAMNHAFAHVVFSTPDEAARALSALDTLPFPSSSSSAPEASSSTANATPRQNGGMRIEYVRPKGERTGAKAGAGGAGGKAAPNSGASGGGLFRERATPAPASQQAGTGGVKPEPDASPVKRPPPAGRGPSFEDVVASTSTSMGAGASGSGSAFAAQPEQPVEVEGGYGAWLRMNRGTALPPQGQAARGDEQPQKKGKNDEVALITPPRIPYNHHVILFKPGTYTLPGRAENARSNLHTALYVLPPALHPPSTHSSLAQFAHKWFTNSQGVKVVSHGFEGTDLRLTMEVPPETARRWAIEGAAGAEAGGGKRTTWTVDVREDGDGARYGGGAGTGGEDEDEVDQLDDDGDAESVQELLRPRSQTFTSTSAFPPDGGALPAPSPVQQAAAAFSFARASTSTVSYDPPPHASPFASTSTAYAAPPVFSSPFPARPLKTTPSSSLLSFAPAPVPGEAADDDTQTARVALPIECRGDGAEARRKRMVFTVREVKRLGGEGKIVLSNHVEGDFLVLEYILDETVHASPPPQPQPAVQPAPPTPAHSHTASPVPNPFAARPPSRARPAPQAAAQTQAQDVEMADVKPVVPPSPVRQAVAAPVAAQIDEDVDELATPAPADPPVRFPLGMERQSRADSRATSQVVEGFLKEYFRRFDQSRASLESIYTPEALFSLKLITFVPARARVPPVPFSSAWLAAAARPGVVITPTAITNAIGRLPPGETDLDKVQFRAQAVPELRVARKKGSTPIAIHLTGEFEEFPEKVVRRFARTFVIKAGKTRAGPGEGAMEYWVYSDQLTVFYKVDGEPSRLPELPKEMRFSPTKRSAAKPAMPPVVQPQLPVTSTSRAALPFAPPPQPREQPTPPRARPAAATSTSAANRPPSITLSSSSSSSSSSDSSDHEAPPAPRRAPLPSSHSPEVTRRPAPAPASAPAPAPAPAARAKQSATSLGKRRAADLEPDGGSEGSGAAPKKKGKKRATVAAAAADPTAEAARLNISREELEKLIQAEVRKAMEKGSGESEGDGRAARERGGKAKEKGKGKQVTTEKTRTTEKGKVKDKVREKERPALGTGLGSSDGRILLTQGTNSMLHGFDGRSNKLRHMVATSPSNFLAVSFLGDIVEWSAHSDALTSRLKKHVQSTDDKFRVDDFAWSDEKDTLVVGFLGVKEGKEFLSPPSQVVLYKREEHPTKGPRLYEQRVEHKPHSQGGVTAVATLPSASRLRFVTGGEDKKIFLWTRQRTTQQLTTDQIRSEHSSMITGLTYLPGPQYVVSAGKDKRLIAYDLERQSSVWQALLPNAVMTVDAFNIDPNLVLARTGAPSNQFTLHDIRTMTTGPPVLTFGYDLTPHLHATTRALTPSNMGRYLYGDMCDTIFAFPDNEQGVKLWDLRNVRASSATSGDSSFSVPPSSSSLKKQHLPGLGRSRVVQTLFGGGGTELCFMEQQGFTRVGIRG
ncbi:hypothetical protein JCM10207_005992 [Rhodosporidiobolus poonsookiae]